MRAIADLQSRQQPEHALLAGRAAEHNHVVFVETSAGVGSGFSDRDYQQAGAKIVSTATEAWNRELVVKVKEPLATEYQFNNKEQILFTYLHFN